MEVDASRGLLGYLAQVPDPRAHNARHRLPDLLAITILAVMCRCEDWVEIAAWGQIHYAWLKTFLALPHGVATHDTFGRVFARLHPQALEECLSRFMQGLVEAGAGRLIAIDGKTLRRSFEAGGRRAAIHMVSAWCSTNHLTLGQLTTDAKSNEITAIPQLLKLLDVRGAWVSIDAMGCQKDIARQIVQQRGDYLLAVKDNHKTLHADVRLFMDEAIAGHWEGMKHDYYQDVDADHGRLEIRRCWVSDEVGWLQRQGHDWPQLGGLVCVEAQRQVFGVDAEPTLERRYYLTSRRPCQEGAQAMLEATRAHWGIENKLHWCLDMVFGEDRSRVRKGHAAENLSRFRRLALTLLRRMEKLKPKTSLKLRRLMCSWNRQLLLDALTGLA
jgi:predicted transposase YbfD/YdcC